MPLVRFLGFPDGAAVSLAASQAGASDSIALASVGGAPSLSINVLRAPSDARYAPEAVWFEAVPENFATAPTPEDSITYDPEFHEIEYLWDFGVPGDTFSAPQNVPDHFRDANSANGRMAAHVFRQGGSFTVTCTARRVVDPDTMEIEEAVADVQIVVGTPEQVWDASNTIVVAHDGDFTGAPASNFQCTEWQETLSGGGNWSTSSDHWAKVLNFDLVGGGPVRVLFKCGGDYSGFNDGFGTSPGFAGRAVHSYIEWGAWGSGDKPVSDRARPGVAGIAMTWNGLHLRGAYDDVTQTGAQQTLWGARDGGYVLLTECDFEGGKIGINHNGGNLEGHPSPLVMVVHDCTMSSLSQYGLYLEARSRDYDGNGSRYRVAYIGSRDLDNGAGPTGTFGLNQQGPVRTWGHEDLIIASCDFFGRYGWSGKGVWPGDGVDATAEQPCIRLFTGGQPSETTRQGDIAVTRCGAEGSEFFAISSNFNSRPPAGNLLLDQIVHVGSAALNTFGNSEMGAVTIRNGLWIKPDVPGGFGVNSLMFFNPTGHNPEATHDAVARLAEPIRIHNNTFILLDAASDIFLGPFGNIDAFVNYSEENCVTYLPRSPTNPRHEDILPVDDTKAWDLRWQGRLEPEDNGNLQTQLAAPDGSASLYRPLSGSIVIGTTVGTLAYRDLLGIPRTSTRSRGAIEPE